MDRGCDRDRSNRRNEADSRPPHVFPIITVNHGARSRVPSMMKIAILAAFLAFAAADPAFEVASVKRQVDVVPGMTFAARGSTLTVVNNELANVIDNAYGIRRYQLAGGPDWIDSDRYNIQAKAAGNPTRDEMMLMTQALLAERFKLK